jgi:hypothetical protein
MADADRPGRDRGSLPPGQLLTPSRIKHPPAREAPRSRRSRARAPGPSETSDSQIAVRAQPLLAIPGRRGQVTILSRSQPSRPGQHARAAAAPRLPPPRARTASSAVRFCSIRTSIASVLLMAARPPVQEHSGDASLPALPEPKLTHPADRAPYDAVLACTGPPDLSGPRHVDCASGHAQPKWPPTRAAIPATRSAADMAGPAYAPLLKGGYVSQDKPAAAESGHPGTPARLAALREVANDAGPTVNQVVPARLTGAEVPLTGASSAAQLDESRCSRSVL